MSNLKHYLLALKNNSYFYWTMFISAVIISLFFGYALGRAYKTYEIRLAEMQNQNKIAQANTQTQIQKFEKELVNPNVYAPRILKLTAVKDVAGNYDLKIDTMYFKHTPENFGKPVEQNTGHANVFVNNRFVTKASGPSVNLPADLFNPGTNSITVSLHANNGNTWWSKKGTLEAKQTIEAVK